MGILTPQRSKEFEFLDDGAHLQVTKNLEEICETFHRYEAFLKKLWPLIDVLLVGRDALRVLELGGAQGAFAVRFLQRTLAKGIRIEYVLSDVNSQGLAVARQRFGSIPLDGSSIEIINLDAKDLGGFGDKEIDLVISLFTLHHIEEEDVVCLFQGARRIARAFAFYDSERCLRAVVGTSFNLRVLPLLGILPPMAKETIHDGVVSQLRAFTPQELREMAAHAGLDVQVERILPWELVVSWLEEEEPVETPVRKGE